MTRNAHEVSDLAALWILRQEEPDWSSEQQAELDAWLAKSMLNRAAYLRQREGWRAADRIAALGLPVQPEETPDTTPWYRAWRPWAVAASVAMVITASTVALQRTKPVEIAKQSFETPVGGRRTVPMIDGSRVELNTATVIRSAMTGQRREIWLDRGEAFFDVAHHDGLPFVVHAGNRRITVLGTKFSVRRESDKVIVSVLRGRVRVDDADNPKSVRSAIITAGDMAIARGPSTLLALRAEEKVESALAWRDGMLNFDDMRLGDAASEFNRYHNRKLLVDDPSVADMRIDGAFQVSNIDAFVRLLHDAYGLKVEQSAQGVRISAR